MTKVENIFDTTEWKRVRIDQILVENLDNMTEGTHFRQVDTNSI